MDRAMKFSECSTNVEELVGSICKCQPVEKEYHVSKLRAKPKKLEACIVKPEFIKHYLNLSVTTSLLFENWEINHKYIQYIEIINCGHKKQHLLYEVPKTSIFSMPIPEPIKVLPGKMVRLPVIFQAKEYSTYKDRVVIQAKKGKFSVSLKAVGTQNELTGISFLQLGMCAVAQEIQNTFTLHNNRTKEVEFKWVSTAPFFVSPSNGIIPPQKSIVITVAFRPNKAGCFLSEILCKNQNTNVTVFSTYVSARAIYPFVYVEINGSHEKTADGFTIDMGLVGVNKVAHRTITLCNPLPVPAVFNIHQVNFLSGVLESHFSFSQTSGEVKPVNTLTLKISYKPQIVGNEDREFWDIKIVAGFGKRILQLTGICEGPAVSLDVETLNFYEVENGTDMTKIVELTNSSSVTTYFQFHTDNNESAFIVKPVSGKIEGKSKKTIKVIFSPHYAITYYRRLACIVHMQSPLFLNLLGSAFTAEVKPIWLNEEYIKHFWYQAKKGLYFIEDSEQLLDVPTPRPLPTPINEYLFDGYHSDFTTFPPPVSLDQISVQFDRWTNLVTPCKKVVTLTNHTLVHLTITWMGDSSHTFYIHPSICEVRPQRALMLEVYFKPTQFNMAYVALLVGYAHCSGHGINDVLKENRIWPPWCLTLRVQGDSFATSNKFFEPIYSISPENLVLPIVPVGYQSTLSFLLYNKTESTPLKYSVTPISDHPIAVRPRNGTYLEAISIIMIGVIPNCQGKYNVDLCVEFNENEKYRQVIHATGYAATALTSFESPWGLYFKPTCIGITAIRKFSIQNLVPIPVHFKWEFPPEDDDCVQCLSVNPTSGILPPCSKLEITWIFQPPAARKYRFDVNFITRSVGTTSKLHECRQLLSVSGTGALGSVMAEPSVLEVGPLLVGKSKIVQVTIHNRGICMLFLQMEIDQFLDNQELLTDNPYMRGKRAIEFHYIDNTIQHCGLSCGGTSDTVQCISLPPHCHRSVEFRVLPRKRGDYIFNVYYRIISSPEASKITFGERKDLCTILMSGVFPLLQIVDSFVLGSGSHIRKKHLSTLLSFNKLNNFLKMDPFQDIGIAKLDASLFPMFDSMDMCPQSELSVEFIIPPAPVNSLPCILCLLLSNPGDITTNWQVLFPKDQKIELEFWAQSDQLDEVEAMEGNDSAENLYGVNPCKGHLLPSASQILRIVYQHQIPGNNCLPIVLQCKGGIEVTLNLTGITIPAKVPYVHLPVRNHTFYTIAIGDIEGTVQEFCLYNHSSVPVHFKIDTKSLSSLSKMHFNHPVLECLTKKAIIPPGEFFSTLWKFWPIEASLYKVDVPFMFDGQASPIILSFMVWGSQDHRPWQEKLPAFKYKVTLPQQILQLSTERIVFGNIPVLCRQRYLVSVVNISKVIPAKFSWDIPYKLLRQRIVIDPATGKLGPGESTICRVTFITGHTPCIYDLDLICEVTPIHHNVHKTPKLPTIQASTRNVFHSTNRSSGNAFTSNRSEFFGYKDSFFTDAQKTKSGSSSRGSVDSSVTSNLPYLMHMEIHAQTFRIKDYWSRFLDKVALHFIERPRTIPQGNVASILKPSSAYLDLELEIREDVIDIIEMMIWGCLDYPDFKIRIEKVAKDPIPYFCQIQQEKTTEQSIPNWCTLLSSKQISSSSNRLIGKCQLKTITNCLDEYLIPRDMKIFSEAVKVTENILEECIWSVLEEALKGDLNLTSRSKVAGSTKHSSSDSSNSSSFPTSPHRRTVIL